MESLFGSRAWTAVTALKLEELREGRNKLWLQSRGHAYGAQLPPATEEKFDDEIPMEAPKDAAA
jgi:hypothetical protein